MTEEMAGSGNGRGQVWVRGSQEGLRVCRWLPLAEVGPQGEKAGEASRCCLKGALTPQADARLVTMVRMIMKRLSPRRNSSPSKFLN